MLTILWSFGIWNQLERWKSLISGCLMSWLKIKKAIVLNCHLLLFYMTIMNTFWIGLCWASKSGFYATTGDDQLSGGTEKKLQIAPKAKFAPEKRSWSLLGGLLLVWSITAFWIPAKPLPLGSMLSKSMRCTENCNACSWHWSTKGPILLYDNAPPHVT